MKNHSKTLFLYVFILSVLIALPIVKNLYNDITSLCETVAVVDESLSQYPKGTFVFDMPTLSRKEKNTIARKFHHSYPKLVDAMLELRREGLLSSDELENVHKFLSEFAVDSTVELPHNDKDLVDYLYDNNIITESQYERILNLMENN